MKPQTQTSVAVLLHSDNKNISIDLNVDETYVYTDNPDKVLFGKTLPLNAMGLGDLFRHLDTTGMIKNDFIFLASNLVHELDIQTIYKQHLEQRKNKPQIVMTLIVAPGKHGIHVYNDNDLLHYSVSSDYIYLPSAINEFTVQNSIRHAMCMICAPDVPLLFTENFDYQTMDDFIKGILESELLDKQFNLVQADKFCMQNTSLDSRVAIEDHYKLSDSKYLRDYLTPSIIDSSIPKSCNIDWHSYIENSTIGKDCTIKNSIICNSNIAAGCVIVNSVIENDEIRSLDSDLKEIDLYKSMITKSKRGDSVNKLLQDEVLEIKDTIFRLINENHSMENVKIELRTLRMSLNCNFDKMRSGIIGTISPKCFSSEKYLHLLTLLKDFTHTVDDEFHCLYELIMDMERNKISSSLLTNVINVLWEADVLNNSLFEWIELKPGFTENTMKVIEATETIDYFKKCREVVKKWEQEESSSESDSSPESESSTDLSDSG
eukprot:NODE_489_length_7778_cov_0.178409.p2 type:complete len:490 gc:universal NODE_489_length_7778_cov_0.178409:1778-309(-)